MTKNSTEKRAAREYARRHDVSYRTALREVREQVAATSSRYGPFARRLLIEAVEGCGIRHWARVDEWDGDRCVTITDLGGETYRLTVENMSSALSNHLDSDTALNPFDIDSYLADEIIQSTLFGSVIYRSEIRRRPDTVA